jgi:3-oxoacyl-[acyl-carrier-protein] synthase-1
MTTLLSDNIISSLGFTAEENYRNVKRGLCGLTLLTNHYGMPEPFTASAIDGTRLEEAFRNLLAETPPPPPPGGERNTPNGGYTKPEKAAIVSIAEALKHTHIDPADPRVLFILSTTKGNIFLLDDTAPPTTTPPYYEPDRIYLWRSAELIARYFGNPHPPITISNACISGAAALLTAHRELQAGRYHHAIVTGVDTLSRFILTGFRALKALSPHPCRPFDAHRTGINLGEAAATLILSERSEKTLNPGDLLLTSGAIRNDACHLSAPSRTGEGYLLALRQTLRGIPPDQIAFINAHGTATPYNDEMESIALTRAGLHTLPVNSLKGYLGHTLGAAGILESILSTRALQEGLILKTRGYETPGGLSHPLPIVTQTLPTRKHRCLKTLSGFGGCNAALLYTKYTPQL